MFNILNNNKGAAYAGLLIAMLIVAGLIVGSFYLRRNQAQEAENSGLLGNNLINTLEEAKQDVEEIDKATGERQQTVDGILAPSGREIIVNIGNGDVLTSPVRIEGTTTLAVDGLAVELRNPEHQALVAEELKVKKTAAGNIFAITLFFEFSNTDSGYLAVYNGNNIIEIPVRYAAKIHD